VKGTRAERALAYLVVLYSQKYQRVRTAKGPEHLHTRRLERIWKHLRAAHDGMLFERSDAK
jgi:hypothetical protein